MPAKSKAQQRLMAAAEHGASFPLAQKVRGWMTHQQLHDFASGSMKGKPQHTKKQLHPALQAHGQKVKAAHAHLTRHVPGFNKQPAQVRFSAIQRHIKRHG